MNHNRHVVRAFEVNITPIQYLTFSQKKAILKTWNAKDLREFAEMGLDFIINDENDYYQLNEFQRFTMPEKWEKAGIVAGIHHDSFFSWDELIINQENDKNIILQCYC